MNERIRILRKDILKLSQQDFADKIGTSRSNIAGYETDGRTPSEAVINLICRTFNVSEKWLRDGVGDPLIPVTRNQQIQAWVNEVMCEEDDSFRKRFAEALTHCSPDFWKELERIALEAVGGKIPDEDK